MGLWRAGCSETGTSGSEGGPGNRTRTKVWYRAPARPTTEIPTAAGKLYLATVIDLYSRRLLGAATGLHPDAELACQAITMAVAARGGADQIRGVIFHTAAPPTPQTTSPSSAGASTSVSQWAGSGRASITPPPKRSSPAWSGRSCRDTTSPTPVRPRPWSSTGATASTTTSVATA